MLHFFLFMSTDRPKDFSIDAAGLRFGIVAARFNPQRVNDLLERVLSTLDGAGVLMEDIETIRVPGSHEVPYVCSMLAKTEEFDAIIGLGLVLAGKTNHHDVIAYSSAHAFQRMAMDYEIPIINGILVVENDQQAEERCSGEINRGREFALAAMEMADLRRRLSERLDVHKLFGDDDLEDLFGDVDFELEDDDDSDRWKS